jgi:tetratricopeptide (TPR) repeat protein
MSSPIPAAPYPGNPSLPIEVREKILSTFRHALNLFSSGNVNDCLIGCEFILKMDPRFTPARRLQEKVRNRDSNVDISELQAVANPATAASPSPAAAPPASAPPPPPPVEKPDTRRLLAEAAQKCDAGDFDGAIAAATRALTLLPGNKDALAMIQKAAGKKATQPLIESTRVRAEEALTRGRLSEARLEVERMRAIDPGHPGIAPLEQRLNAAPPPGSGDPAPLSDISLDQGSDPFALDSAGEGREPRGSFTGFSRDSSEPAGLDPYSSQPSASPGPDAEEGGSFPSSAPPPGAEAPFQASSAFDLFLPPEESAPPVMPSPLPPPSVIPPLPGGPVLQAEEEDARISEQEISALLKQGDEVARKGERQQAIEIWSRVFLIDINNAEAVTRIERARQEMADKRTLVADCLKKGRESFEAGNREEAKKHFLQAQSLDPGDATARLYLERIEGGSAGPAPPGTGTGGAGKTAVTPGPAEDFPGAAARPPAAPPTPARRRGGLAISSKVVAVIGAFLALSLVGVYFVFKGARSRESPPKVVSTGSVQNARDLLGKGKIAEARAELRRIGPGDADSEEAQRLLADLGKNGPETLGGRGARSGQPPAGASPEGHGDTDPARLRAAAEKALAEKRYIEALKNFNLAAPAFRNDPSFTQEQGLASDKVTALTPAVKFYNEGEYDTAIPILWRIVQEDRDNLDARGYLLRSYYNEGITQLQNGLYPKAAQAFQEALSLDPNDAEAVRHKKFAERYQKGDLDLMGRIYVRHLNHRP